MKNKLARDMTKHEFATKYGESPGRTIVSINKLLSGNIQFDSLGICDNISNGLFVYENSSNWEYFTGCKTFPIPTTDEQFNTPSQQYSYSSYKNATWKGKQGELRIDLCKHLIKELELCIANG